MRVNSVITKRIAGQRRIDRHQREQISSAALTATRGVSPLPPRFSGKPFICSPPETGPRAAP